MQNPNRLRWINQPLILYHGTIERYARRIEVGLDITNARVNTDFGRGFYTTTWREQAITMSSKIEVLHPGERPYIVIFMVDRNTLSGLRMLSFVRGDRNADDFWALVRNCRLREANHANHAVPDLVWYDVVSGPVAKKWRRNYECRPGYDQISFHTERALNLLDDSFARIENV